MTVRDVSDLLYPAVMETIAALGKLGEDSAARKLAERYAKTIDESWALGPKVYASQLRWLGPELLRTLESLGATPASRKTAGKSENGAEKPKNALEALREARSGRRA